MKQRALRGRERRAAALDHVHCCAMPRHWAASCSSLTVQTLPSMLPSPTTRLYSCYSSNRTGLHITALGSRRRQKSSSPLTSALRLSPGTTALFLCMHFGVLAVIKSQCSMQHPARAHLQCIVLGGMMPRMLTTLHLTPPAARDANYRDWAHTLPGKQVCCFEP